MSQDKDPNLEPMNNNGTGTGGAFPSAPSYSHLGYGTGGPFTSAHGAGGPGPSSSWGFGPVPSAPAYAHPGFSQGVPFVVDSRHPSRDEMGFPVMGENNPLHNMHGPPQPPLHAGFRHNYYYQGPYAQMPYKQYRRSSEIPPFYDDSCDECYEESESDEQDDVDDDYDNAEKEKTWLFSMKLLMVLLLQHLVLFLLAIDKNYAVDYMRNNLFTTTGNYVAPAVYLAVLIRSCRKRELNLAPFSVMTLSLAYMVGMLFIFSPTMTVVMLICLITITAGVVSV